MKEKLVKNHYKGFDKRAKVVSFCCIGLFIASAAAFLPLTIAAQNRNIEAKQNEEGKTQQASLPQTKDKAPYIIDIEGC